MPINRAAIFRQLLFQLQNSLADSAEVSLLRHNTTPTNPASKPLVVLKLGAETLASELEFGRQLQLTVETQISPTTPTVELVLLDTLDTLAEAIELAFIDQDEAHLWMNIMPQKTDFAFTSSAEGMAVTMSQTFELSYLVIREEVCTAPAITEVYLSKQGGPHELVATLPAD
jgi:hypothetical protein